MRNAMAFIASKGIPWPDPFHPIAFIYNKAKFNRLTKSNAFPKLIRMEEGRTNKHSQKDILNKKTQMSSSKRKRQIILHGQGTSLTLRFNNVSFLSRNDKELNSHPLPLV